ncbi:MAG: DUF3822 family protein [Chitinophagaceae bacterium]|nr:MAG: DUF3822 family protein [Chitinophagaceae bacterium]
MNVLFDIQGSGRPDRSLLLCEWGEGYCCMALVEPDGPRVHRLKYWSLADPLEAGARNALVRELEVWGRHVEKAVFCSAFPESVLVPQRFSGGAVWTEVLSPLRGGAHEDRIGEWQLSNHYLLPAPIDNALRTSFPAAEYYHAHTAALKNYNGIDAPEQAQVHFAPGQFRVLLRKSGQLQLAQVYRYSTPLDAVYYLLRILDAAGLPHASTPLVLSGLIDEQSALYRELHQYFGDLRFTAPEGVPNEEGRPAHFFTSLYNLARCVS